MIVALENARRELIGMKDSIVELGSALRIEETKERLIDLEAQTTAPDFWNNADNSSKVLQVIKQSQDKVAGYERLCARLEDAIALAEMAIEENDDSFVEEVESELAAIVAEEEHRRIEVLLSGEYDKSTAIVSFHPGAGGTEAQDWAQMLYRMITRWAEKSGFQVKLTDWLDGDGAGIKSATVMVVGMNAYGYLIPFFFDCISQALAFLLNLKTPNMPNSQMSVEQRIEGKMVIQRLSPLNPSFLSLKWYFGRHLDSRLVWEPLYMHISLLATHSSTLCLENPMDRGAW